MCNTMPLRSIAARRAVEISASRKGSSAPRPSIRWTFAPSAANVQAYSQPTAPAPTTAIDSGSRSSSRIVSESYTSGLPNGKTGGRAGDDPVAIKMYSACSRTSAVPAPVFTLTVCGSSNSAFPSITLVEVSFIRFARVSFKAALTPRW